MDDHVAQVNEAADFLTKRMTAPPQIGILTGTGLGDVAASVERHGEIAYTDIPHFPVSTVQSHAGRLLHGAVNGRQALVCQGRFHLYEGYTPLSVTFPVRVMQALGVRLLIVTNASGGLNPDFVPGDVMIIADHINLTAENPLVGPNHDPWGPRFPDMSDAYDAALRKAAVAAAGNRGIPYRLGVYAGLKGPSLETPAEVRFLRLIGADAVGFSTVMEVIAGVHAGMRVLGLSTITNVHTPDHPVPATVEEIIETAKAAAPHLDAIIRAVAADPDL